MTALSAYTYHGLRTEEKRVTSGNFASLALYRANLCNFDFTNK